MSVALVTGASRRLGRHIAVRLAQSGFDVAVHCRVRDDDAVSVVNEIELIGRKADIVIGDLSAEADVAQIIASARAALGPVSVLVNSASVFEDDRALTATRASWDRHLNVNLRAPLVLSQMFARQVSLGADGAIINIIDQNVLNLTPQFFSYTVSKAALWAMTQTLAQSLAPGIRVNAVAPGPSLMSQYQSHEHFAEQVQATLLRRPSSPEEIAKAVDYLVSAKSVTGQLLVVDSGQHLAWSGEFTKDQTS